MPHADPVERLAYAADWARRNPEKRRETLRRWRERNRSALRRNQRTYNMRRYGVEISPEEVERLHENQRGRCAICDKRPPESLQIDHDHRTLEVRGLLCGKCNRALGLFEDDPLRLRAAADYLGMV